MENSERDTNVRNLNETIQIDNRKRDTTANARNKEYIRDKNVPDFYYLYFLKILIC